MSIKLPSVLSFERKMETSDALMYAGNWGHTEKPNPQEWLPIPITKRQNRSTQSAYGIDDAKKSEPNPVSSDSDDANLPHDTDTLKVCFSLRVIGNVGKPFACNAPEFEAAISKQVQAYKETGKGLKLLALRYAHNIVNGRFLWRNRVCAEKIFIQVKTEGLFGHVFQGRVKIGDVLEGSPVLAPELLIFRHVTQPQPSYRPGYLSHFDHLLTIIQATPQHRLDHIITNARHYDNGCSLGFVDNPSLLFYHQWCSQG